MVAASFARLLVAASLACGWALASSAQDVLPPEQVFKYTSTADAQRVHLHFTVLDGYYLYRNRFEFASATEGVTLGAVEFPKGEIHEDEYFGKQETYRHAFDIAIPYRAAGAASALNLKLRLQGCADIGLCYPPQDWTTKVSLPAGRGTLDLQTTAPSSLPLTAATDDVLPPDEAFIMNARFDGPNELTVAWQIAPGYYLYRDKLEFRTAGNIEIGKPELPDGVAHTDDNFGDVKVFRDYVEAKIPLSRASPDALDVVVTAGFQGCKDNSVCYPPGEQTMPLVLPATREFPASAVSSNAGPAAVPASEQDQWGARVMNGSWWAMLGWFYLGGLALSLTPCVLPMVPILSSIIAGQGGTVSTSRGFMLSLSYVLGMAATYTVAGALAALAGGQIQALFQKTWIIASFAGLFVVLSLGMFGLFELQMPTAIQTRLANLANKQRAGTFLGTAIIGALTALIVTTCVAPPLIGALTVISQTGDVARGSSALFALSMGMGSPLLLVGASAGQLLPRVGPWMNTVKAGFGVMMLGVAIWMLQRIVPGAVALALWSLLVFLSGVFLGAFDPLPENARPPRRLAKGLGVLACLYGALLLIGATLGGNDPLRPIPQGALAANGGGPAGAPKPALEFRQVESIAALQASLMEARAAHRPVMLDFTADWCVSCKEMEKYTFPDPQVISALKPYMLLRADVTANDSDDQALLKQFKSFGPPTIAFFDASGQPQDSFKLVGFTPADKFRQHVERLAAL